MLPLRVPLIVENSLQSPFFSYNISHDLRHIALKHDLAAPRQPPQDMERIRVHTRRMRHASIVRQTRLQYDLKRLQPPAVAQPQPYEIGETIQYVMVTGYGEYDVLYERT